MQRFILIGLMAGFLATSCTSNSEGRGPAPIDVRADLPTVEGVRLTQASDAMVLDVSADGIRVSMERVCQASQRKAREIGRRSGGWYSRLFGDDEFGEVDEALEDTCGSGRAETWVDVMSLEDAHAQLATQRAASSDDAPKHVIKPLGAELTEMAAHAERLARVTKTPWEPTLIIAADRDLPWSTLVALYHTAGRAGFNRFEFLTNAKNPRANVFSPPRIKMPLCCGDGNEDELVECAAVDVILSRDAGYVVMNASNYRPGFRLPSGLPHENSDSLDAPREDDEPAREKTWRGSPVTAGDCPISTRHEDGGFNPSGVMELVEGFDEVPYCGRANVLVTARGWTEVTYEDALVMRAQLPSVDGLDEAVWSAVKSDVPRCEDAYELR